MGKIYIFHHHDHDGIISGAIMKHWAITTIEKDDIEYKPDDSIMSYSIDYAVRIDDLVSPTTIAEDDVLIFVDYSFSNNYNIKVLNEYFDHGANIIWIDHHVTSVEVRNEYAWFLDFTNNFILTDKCAAILCYEWARNHRLYDLVRIRGIYDTQSHSIADKIADDKYIYPNDFLKQVDIWDRHDMSFGIYEFEKTTLNFHRGLTLIITDDLDQVISIGFITEDDDEVKSIARRYIETGSTISQYINTESRYQLKYAFPCTIAGHSCIALNRKGPSEIFMEEYRKFDIVCSFIFDGDRWQYSLFSGNNTLCLPIAKHFGGGGHPYACGFSTKELILKAGCIIDINN